jgi:exonuclease VII small subunit
VSSEDSLSRAEELLERLEAARAELEQVAERDDPEAAIDILQRLAELAKEIEAELQRARREAGA